MPPIERLLATENPFHLDTPPFVFPEEYLRLGGKTFRGIAMFRDGVGFFVTPRTFMILYMMRMQTYEFSMRGPYMRGMEQGEARAFFGGNSGSDRSGTRKRRTRNRIQKSSTIIYSTLSSSY